MKTENKKKILTMTLRDSLKELMQKEIENFPEYLEKLEPKERLNILCRLMPFVFPKVESIHPTEGEPWTLS